MVHFKLIESLGEINGIHMSIVECVEDFLPSEIIGDIIMIDEDSHQCQAFDRLNLDAVQEVNGVLQEMTIWSGEKIKLYSYPQSFQEDEQETTGETFIP